MNCSRSSGCRFAPGFPNFIEKSDLTSINSNEPRGYYRRREKISYWHTYNNQEVDAVIGDAKVAIEIKSSEEVKTRHKNGLKAFKEEHPECRLILVSLDPITRPSGEIELLYINDFLRMLWNGEIF